MNKNWTAYESGVPCVLCSVFCNSITIDTLPCCLIYLVWYYLGDVIAFTNADLAALCIALHLVMLRS